MVADQTQPNVQTVEAAAQPAGHNDHYKMELPGLGNHRAVEILAELVRRKVPIILFLMETKLNVREMEPIKTELGFQSMLVVSSEGRRGGLALLRHLRSRSTLPWVCLGDYNEILSSEEKNGGLPKPLPPMLDFRSALLFCGLINLGYC